MFSRQPNFLSVNSPWPYHNAADIISIVLLCGNAKDLFEILSIETADDLEKVQRETMLNLFYSGQAFILCATADGDSLQFEKVGDTMVAIIDGVNRGHEVKEQLILAGDFIRYTTNYFHFKKGLKKNK